MAEHELKIGYVYYYCDGIDIKEFLFMNKVHNRKQYYFRNSQGKRKKISNAQLEFLFEQYNDAGRRIIEILEAYVASYRTSVEHPQGLRFLEGEWTGYFIDD